MKKSLLLLGVIAALAIGAPAYSQYIYLDVNGDGVNTSSDALTSSTLSVDVWLNTNHNKAGGVVACADGTNPLDIGSYDVILHASGTGSVGFGAWTNSMTGYAQVNPPTTAGADFAVGFGSAGSFNTAGLYKLGSIAVAITGQPVISFSTTPMVGSSSITGFGSECSGSDNPNTMTLGLDFFDNSGTASPTPVNSTTWGKIKQLYR